MWSLFFSVLNLIDYRMEKLLLQKYKEMGEIERKKVKELLKDKQKNDDDSEKIGWLYKPDKPDPEEYLLGKRIDKTIERDLDKDSADKDAPGALFKEVVSRRAEMDMQVKMREDPLYAIRKKEEEERRKVLNNPVKMKQLMKVIEEKKEKTKKTEKKKKKEKKSHKTHSSDSSSDESGDELLKKYLAIVEQKKKNDFKETQKDSAGSSREHKSNSSQRCKETHEKKKRQHREEGSDDMSDKEHNHHVRSKRHHGFEDSDDNRPSGAKRFKNYGLNKTRDDRDGERRTHRGSNSEERDDNRRHQRKSSCTPTDSRQREHHREPTKRKLTSEEMEKKRVEMMENARIRDEERVANIKRYKAEDEESEKKQSGSKGGAKFIKPMILKHAEKSSVEDRIKRNVYNIQRTKAELDKDFTKR